MLAMGLDAMLIVKGQHHARSVTVQPAPPKVLTYSGVCIHIHANTGELKSRRLTCSQLSQAAGTQEVQNDVDSNNFFEPLHLPNNYVPMSYSQHAPTPT